MGIFILNILLVLKTIKYFTKKQAKALSITYDCQYLSIEPISNLYFDLFSINFAIILCYSFIEKKSDHVAAHHSRETECLRKLSSDGGLMNG